MQSSRKGRTQPKPFLTRQEHAVLLRAWFSLEETSEDLGIAPGTVSNYRRYILEKLYVPSMRKAMAVALQHRLTTIDEVLTVHRSYLEKILL